MEQSINQSVITPEGSGCDKRKKLLRNFAKNPLLSDVHRQYV